MAGGEDTTRGVGRRSRSRPRPWLVRTTDGHAQGPRAGLPQRLCSSCIFSLTSALAPRLEHRGGRLVIAGCLRSTFPWSSCLCMDALSRLREDGVS